MENPKKTLPDDEVNPASAADDAPADNFLGRLQGVVTITGDIESPVEPAEAREVLR